MRKKLLYAGASITMLFALLHSLFWKLGSWHTELLKLTPDNSGIMQMLNVASIYMLICGAGVTVVLARKPTFVWIEKAFLAFMAGYYLMRIAFGLPFFGFSMVEAIVWMLCLIVASCYLFALPQWKRIPF
jgi:hypothetical protein